MSEANTISGSLQNSSGAKTNPVISQAFVPTSVLRKFHCDKHDQVGQKLSVSFIYIWSVEKAKTEAKYDGH